MSATLLNADQIQTLRVEWIDDFIDLRPQWGTPISGAASKGDVSLTLTGLASVGTLQAGTRFGMTVNGQAMMYSLTVDALISSGSATIAFTPPLLADVLNGTSVIPEPRQKSLYNKRTGRLYFTDPELQDLAERAMRLRARAIRSADDPDSMFFRAIRYYAWTAMLSSDEWLNAILSGTDFTGANTLLAAQKQTVVVQDAAIVFYDQTGPQNVRFVR